MKLLSTLAAIALILIPICAMAANTKAESVATTLKVVNKVYELSGKPATKQNVNEFKQHFLPVLNEVSDPVALANIAIICNQLSWPGKAGDQSVDEYFDRCLFLSVRAIAKIKGPTAQRALEDVARRLPLVDGSLGLLIKEARAAQKKLNGEK